MCQVDSVPEITLQSPAKVYRVQNFVEFNHFDALRGIELKQGIHQLYIRNIDGTEIYDRSRITMRLVVYPIKLGVIHSTDISSGLGFMAFVSHREAEKYKAQYQSDNTRVSLYRSSYIKTIIKEAWIPAHSKIVFGTIAHGRVGRGLMTLRTDHIYFPTDT